MQETGGVRKVRFALPHRGKSGSVRICYVDFGEYAIVYLLTVFAKNEKDNISKEEKSELKQLVKVLKKEAAERFRHE